LSEVAEVHSKRGFLFSFSSSLLLLTSCILPLELFLCKGTDVLDPSLKRFLLSNKIGTYANGLLDLECYTIPALTELCEEGINILIGPHCLS